nr:hypothetical protein Iba_chr09aCG2680 [Ipomoea batatas]GMD35046.1 hypothetical protein Iba_chr09dCG3220 [Ipomoea batatas]GMD36758.1 hypothetical protein Iba_chr09eCG3020 [Ipomoea batatas]
MEGWDFSSAVMESASTAGISLLLVVDDSSLALSMLAHALRVARSLQIQLVDSWSSAPFLLNFESADSEW